jgi:hypothetical protein
MGWQVGRSARRAPSLLGGGPLVAAVGRRRVWMICVLSAVVSLSGDARGQGVVPDEHSPIPTCEQRRLSPDIELLVRPVLLARAEALSAGREWDANFEHAFYSLLERRSASAREAQTALMAYYTGERYAEDLLRVASSRSTLFAPLVTQYKTCRPMVSFEDQLGGIVVLRTIYQQFESRQTEIRR